MIRQSALPQPFRELEPLDALEDEAETAEAAGVLELQVLLVAKVEPVQFCFTGRNDI
jgi:hypothetical protein